MNTPQKRRNPMMTNWYERSIHMLQLNGKGERTQEAYTRAVRMLTEFYGQTPDRITEEELQEYFLHRKNLPLWSPNTMRICDFRDPLFLRPCPPTQLASLQYPARSD
jgi:Phage integrase, N-terminal SAM-like domain